MNTINFTVNADRTALDGRVEFTMTPKTTLEDMVRFVECCGDTVLSMFGMLGRLAEYKRESR